MEDTQKQEDLTYLEAASTVRDYCCSVCWGHLLIMRGENKLFRVECARFGREHFGFVKKNYADRRRAESRAELSDARYNLSSLFGVENKQASEEILHDLGF